MRHFFLEILLPFILTSLPSHILAKEIPLGNSHQHTALAPDTDKFYTKSAYLPQLLDQLLSRKGKIGLVRELPLVSGEKKSNPILPIVTDIFLSQLDSNLKPVLESINNFFLAYKKLPTKLESLQMYKCRFLTGEDQIWNLLEVPDAKVELNRTYLLRSLQFKLPEIILKTQPISRGNSHAKKQLGQVPSSDTIITFKTVEFHRDGSYTILIQFCGKLFNIYDHGKLKI